MLGALGGAAAGAAAGALGGAFGSLIADDSAPDPWRGTMIPVPFIAGPYREPDAVLPPEDPVKKQCLEACEGNEVYRLILVELHPEYFVAMPPAPEPIPQGFRYGTITPGVGKTLDLAAMQKELERLNGKIAASMASMADPKLNPAANLPPLPDRWADNMKEIYPAGTRVRGHIAVGGKNGYRFSFNYRMKQDSNPIYGITLPEFLSDTNAKFGQYCTDTDFQEWRGDDRQFYLTKITGAPHRQFTAMRCAKRSDGDLDVAYGPV